VNAAAVVFDPLRVGISFSWQIPPLVAAAIVVRPLCGQVHLLLWYLSGMNSQFSFGFDDLEEENFR
jgi:hypothetical protein